MATHTLDIGTFRLLFPEFKDAETFPDAYLLAQFDMAAATMGADDGWALSGAALGSALNLLTAHLVKLNATISAGGSAGMVGVVTGATIDKVSVQMAAPPVKSAWAQWLASTPYGLQLWGLLSARSAGGLYIGGSPERAAFRGVGGFFR